MIKIKYLIKWMAIPLFCWVIDIRVRELMKVCFVWGSCIEYHLHWWAMVYFFFFLHYYILSFLFVSARLPHLPKSISFVRLYTHRARVAVWMLFHVKVSKVIACYKWSTSNDLSAFLFGLYKKMCLLLYFYTRILLNYV